jgi:hypothetical protein
LCLRHHFAKLYHQTAWLFAEKCVEKFAINLCNSKEEGKATIGPPFCCPDPFNTNWLMVLL